MSAVETLFAENDAFAYTERNRVLFVEAMSEMLSFHRTHCPIYDTLCRLKGFESYTLDSEEDLVRIPHIMTTALKEMVLLSVPKDEIVQHLTSSGTSGQQTQLFWDAESQQRQSLMRRRIVETFGLCDPNGRVNYLVFSYDPATSGEKGAAHTHIRYMSFAPAAETVYAITEGVDGQPSFDVSRCVEALERFAASGLPLRVVGFPAFGYRTLQELRKRNKHFRFPDNSLLFSGGGWKLHTGEAIPYEAYAALVQEVLGIRKDRIRDIYGMVEHGVPYLTCEQGRFHIPIYSRVWALHPATQEVLPYGTVGLLKLITPYIRSMPTISVLSTDWGAILPECECGRPGPILLLKGRAGVRKYAGCAISAAQLLAR